jgi:hypothetical protein
MKQSSPQGLQYLLPQQIPQSDPYNANALIDSYNQQAAQNYSAAANQIQQGFVKQHPIISGGLGALAGLILGGPSGLIAGATLPGNYEKNREAGVRSTYKTNQDALLQQYKDLILPLNEQINAAAAVPAAVQNIQNTRMGNYEYGQENSPLGYAGPTQPARLPANGLTGVIPDGANLFSQNAQPFRTAQGMHQDIYSNQPGIPKLDSFQAGIQTQGGMSFPQRPDRQQINMQQLPAMINPALATQIIDAMNSAGNTGLTQGVNAAALPSQIVERLTKAGLNDASTFKTLQEGQQVAPLAQSQIGLRNAQAKVQPSIAANNYASANQHNATAAIQPSIANNNNASASLKNRTDPNLRSSPASQTPQLINALNNALPNTYTAEKNDKGETILRPPLPNEPGYQAYKQIKSKINQLAGVADVAPSAAKADRQTRTYGGKKVSF